MCPFRSKARRRQKTGDWFERHKAERAAYMRKYRRRRRLAQKKSQ